jgi:voltage-gated potassium channel
MAHSTDGPPVLATAADSEAPRFLLGTRGFKEDDDRSRVDAYQRRWRMPLDMLALVTIWLIVVPPGVITSKHALYVVLLVLRLAISLTYAVDLAVRTALAPRHWYYLRKNPLSIATIFVPFLRVLFSLQLLRSVFQRGNLGRFALAAVMLFLNLTVVVYFFESRAPNGNIKTFGDSLWWAVVTLTTVGYGDYYPVTVQGRLAATLLMFVGFAVLATVTAQISSAFIDQAARARAKASTTTSDRVSDQTNVSLESIADRLGRIEAQLGGGAPPT